MLTLFILNSYILTNMQLLKYHLPVIVCAGLIFFVSSISVLPTEIPDFNLRDKLVHFVEFAFFGILLWRSVAQWRLPLRGSKMLILALSVGIIYAASDEVHQFYVPGRDGNIMDWIADAIGLAVGVGSAYIFKARRDLNKSFAGK
ncbi:MAG: hypothetical protein GY839_18040 [candidate division Zixibacteria bacterium]|nr:hypothetical protein [candidate division Zixibacteria bacterium]